MPSHLAVETNYLFQLDDDCVRLPDIALLVSTGVHTPLLVADVFHEDNTRREMEIKLGEYAKAGVKLVWYVDPERQEVDVYPKGNAKRKKTLGVKEMLDGGEALPGFTMPVAKIFEKRAPGKKSWKKA
jgi:Uma2 family endonuclease